MLTHDLLNQHPALTLDIGALRVVVLPKKGADICALIHVASGVDFLLKTPGDCNRPGGSPPRDF